MKKIVMDYKIKTLTMHINFTPFAIAKMSDGIFQSAKNTDNVIPAVKYFLYCVSIELGLKASILSKDNSLERKKANREKIGHDLLKAYSLFKENFNNEIFEQSETRALEKINPHFMKKGLEYFDMDTIVAHINGSLPEVNKIKKSAEKVNNFIKNRNYYNG